MNCIAPDTEEVISKLVAVAGGPINFWAAWDKVYAETRQPTLEQLVEAMVRERQAT